MQLPYTETRPWGNFVQFTEGDPTIKIITVNPGQSLSLQYHDKRDEEWLVVHGSGTIRVGDTETEAHKGDSFSIPRGTLHRATGGPDGLIFHEEAHGTFEEDDIYRTEDMYGRSQAARHK